MEDSYISLDLYPLIVEKCDFTTLSNMKDVNVFCNEVCKKEQKKRLRSCYPFGDKNAKIKVIMNEIAIEKVLCILTEGKVVEIPPHKYSVHYVREVLTNWFLYNFNTEEWHITTKLVKSIIRHANKTQNEDGGLHLTFEFKDKKSYLIDIV